jgi:nitrite reductase/ring-hydroxylating ferredoxin subunit
VNKLRVGLVSDLPPGSRAIVDTGRMKVGVFNVDGAFHAIPNMCVHQWGPVCQGNVTGTLEADAADDWNLRWTREGRIIICPWHAAEYDLTSGECLSFPGRRLRKYAVTIDANEVFVEV